MSDYANKDYSAPTTFRRLWLKAQIRWLEYESRNHDVVIDRMEQEIAALRYEQGVTRADRATIDDTVMQLKCRL